ncbi:Dynein heavy chain 10, axonemal [Liparis tanakae]|uniref:Dynein heavy chain 10, axonemal n=1 Tax=Liparis tanakae TaxID=230148 RepID=A0A4Z2GJG1_9TELE|nr:Dynein heavy chain 10, axonemal [Liparis tanakae]
MVHDDVRVEWLQQCVSAGFTLPEESRCVEELLGRGDGEEEDKITRYLNVVSEEDSPLCLLFFKTIREEEIEVEIPVERERDGDSLDPDKEPGTQSEAEMTSASEEANEQSPSHRLELQVVYRIELHVAVNEYPERFLKSTVFYFLRNTKETVVEPMDMNEASKLMPRLFDIGMHNGPPPFVLQNQLANVYIPLITAHQMQVTGAGYESRAVCPPRETSAEGEEESPGKSNETMLNIPELDLEPEVDDLLSNPEMVEKLEQCVMNWRTQITIVIELQLNKKPQGSDPLAEIAFWQERASILSGLSEQLKQPRVCKILEVMTKADTDTAQTMQGTVAELTKYRVESEDNVRFLSTLERHFMYSLTMCCALDRDKREVAKSKVHDAKLVLDKWKSSYFQVRAEIEESGRNQRWEFDRRRLFERADYMASVCQDYHSVLQVLEEFYINFGPELKSVTGDPKRIDEVLCRVDNLVLPIEDISFNPFNICKMSSWRIIMQDFNTTVQAIEGEAIDFIDQSFKSLRSSAAAFDMLLKFKNIRSREAINNHLMRKFNDILAQYCKEVGVISEIFEEKKDNPPLNRNEPPVAGAIRWAQSLFQRIKHTILQFLEVPEMLKSEQYKADVPSTEKRPHISERYMVNFAPEIKEIISETKHLVTLGYCVPYLAQSVSLQEHNFIRYVNSLNNVVNCYHSVMERLSIPDFINRGLQAVSKFELVVNQIQKNEKDIESKLQSIVMANLLKYQLPDKSNDLPSVKEFCERIERERTKSVNLLSRKYADIGPLITKTEHLIMGTSTGKAQCMADYYKYWERKVLDSLIKMVLRNTQNFNVVLRGDIALFQIDVILSAPKIVLQPQISEIYWLIMQCIKDCVESTKLFVRWMHGTCIECPPQRVGGEDEVVIFSFYTDVWQHPQINESAMAVSQNIHRLFQSVEQYLLHWKHYRSLWEKNKTVVNERFAARKPSCVMFDDKLQSISRIKQEVMLEPLFRNENIIRLNLEPLAHSLQEAAESRITSLAGLLNKPAKEDVFNLRDEFMQLSEKLKQKPDTFDDLKSVLGSISDIRSMSLDVELRFIDIQERYRTVAMYKVEVGEDELELVANIEQMWNDLFAESKQVDRSLSGVKKTFTQTTTEDIEEYTLELSIFAENFNMHGPGAVGDDLEKGLTIMETYEADLAKMVTGRQELANAEKLLDLPVTVYPGVVSIEKDMDGLRQIYAVFKAQQDAKTEWSQTLWADLNIQLLQEGVEGFIKRLRKLPKDVRGLPVAFFLEGRMKEFRESLPLLLDLKNEALRERHWKELMERTGTSFEMNPESFTLENMFAMDLHKYANVIGDIVTAADRGFVLGAVDEILQNVDNDAMNLQSMAGSRFVGPFLGTIQQWEKDLSLISETIEIMSDTAKGPNIKRCCLIPNRLTELQALSDGLERCQKSLNDYLDSKRNAFPRFFFISDDELLSILGSNDPSCVQEHIIKMYDNIASLRFDVESNGGTVAGAMVSAEGEVMELKKPVPVEGRVEEWMIAILLEMRRTNRLITKEAIFDYCKDRNRVDWMLLYQGMVVLATNQVWWTWEVEDVFKNVEKGEKYALKKYASEMHKQIDELVKRITQPMKINDRRKINTVLIIDVHARDIVDSFVLNSIMDAQEFEWESQLRFYWVREQDNLFVRQCSAAFSYGYEYMGLNGRLALSMYLGGAPAGPAGTGKTESTKDLAKALGLLCVVTNCGEGMDYMAVGKILSGLAQCGAWGCFDEFNRIDASVLSVISSQIQTIRNALILKLKRFHFEGQDISLDSRMGIFITMNPGYAGRTELPESVKALFRPVVVIVPDLQQICEIMLFSEGFLMAKVLAKKMTVLYKLAREQLSKQSHYDFGLRALKSVLVMAGELKRGSPDLSEDVVLMRALRDMNLPKFVFEDVPLFLGLISDLFPGLDCPRVRYPNLNDAVEEILQENNYVMLSNQVDKVVQMYETMMTRHTIMIVGPTGGGKSVVINTLCQAQTRLGFQTKMYPLNPKAMSVIELYGILDPDTRDWTDGILSNIFRDINKPTDKKERRYILFDGDVDALWVENMNSVMDDNKILTLANGERIRLQNHCALLFEVGDLQYASPATVSRCGMVFVDPKNLRYTPYWQRWIKNRPDREQEVLNKLFEKYVHSSIDMIVDGIVNGKQGQKLKTVVPQTDLNMVTQLCLTLDALLENESSSAVLESYFLEALYCSLGATLLEKGRIKFDEFIKKLSNLTTVQDETSLAGPGEIPVPTIETTRANWILEQMVKIKRPVLLVGESGTSKTATIHNFLKNLNSDTRITLIINFSSRTTSMDLQRNLEANVEKRTKETYGPPMGKRLLVFMDDMNMPKVDQYGTQQPIALLKLLLNRGGIYDRGKDLNYKTLKDLGFIAAMGKAGGGRNEVDPRFISIFSVFSIPFPAMDSLNRIYASIIKGHTTAFEDAIQKACDKVTFCTLELYNNIIKDLPPTPSKFHYIFNLRDLSRVYNGLTLTKPDRSGLAPSLQ